MSIRKLSLSIAAISALALSTPAFAEVTNGEMVPDFTVTDTNGVTHNLSDFKGKKVVLEWTNHGCPYVVRHYGEENMQNLQAAKTSDDTVWLSVISSAPGNQGYMNAAEANAKTAELGASPTAVILDPSGDLGRTFAAKTTPHMFVIDEAGKLAYQGAIDDKPRGPAATATGYVTAAVSELNMGKAVSTPQTTPYGCSVKY